MHPITFVFFFSQLFQDVFFLTVEELYAFVEGRSVTNDLRGLVDLRRKEYDGYRKGMPPPERLMTTGACGLYFLYPQVLNDLDLLRDLEVTRMHLASQQK